MSVNPVEAAIAASMAAQMNGGGSGGSGGGLTVVEIGEFDADGNYTLSETEISALEAAAASMMPVVIKFGHDGTQFAIVFNFMSMGGGYMSGFTAHVNGYDYMFMNAMGSWQAMANGT